MRRSRSILAFSSILGGYNSLTSAPYVCLRRARSSRSRRSRSSAIFSSRSFLRMTAWLRPWCILCTGLSFHICSRSRCRALAASHLACACARYCRSWRLSSVCLGVSNFSRIFLSSALRCSSAGISTRSRYSASMRSYRRFGFFDGDTSESPGLSTSPIGPRCGRRTGDGSPERADVAPDIATEVGLTTLSVDGSGGGIFSGERERARASLRLMLARYSLRSRRLRSYVSRRALSAASFSARAAASTRLRRSSIICSSACIACWARAASSSFFFLRASASRRCRATWRRASLIFSFSDR
mmetsp:Transcript_27160/g.94169  ORF Transcript_27160/g.94169 Transcript_27160/m.94169 type:complete len:299 (-) Transcript_27160:2315-3211(-)